jgi:ATP-binding cassette, subfamily B, bacterial
LYLLFEYLRRTGQAFYDFAAQFGNLVRQATDIKGTKFIFEAYEKLNSKEIELQLNNDWNKIEIKDLKFTYDKKYNLDLNLDFTFHKGEKIALVGPSGSGKSTFLKIMRGLELPENCNVFIDNVFNGNDLFPINNSSSLIPQEPEIFADTIAFNVSFGFEGDILTAVNLSQFMSVLQKLPQELHTNISEKGVNLSGGEKQRLALARGLFFLQDSKIILLDEPTSSVDLANERAFYENIINKYPDKVIISSVHKPHLLELFDTIYIFNKGKIVQFGKPENIGNLEKRFNEFINSPLNSSL